MIIRQRIYIISIIRKGMGKLKTHSPTYCIMDNWENMLNLTHTRQIISDRHFISSMSSDKVCTVIIMRWCNVQTNEYDLQSKTYPTIYTHHKLHNTNENKFPVSRNVYTISDRIWWNNPLRHPTTENIKTMGKVDTSNLIMIITCYRQLYNNYRYILSITYT